jgi:outer membrane immunogenic protein
MKVKSALLGLAAASGGLLMSANVASAGYSAPARSVAAPTWTGCYVGIAGGWAWGESKHKEQLISSTTATPVTVTTATIASFDLDGGLIGGTAGCNLQSSGGCARRRGRIVLDRQKRARRSCRRRCQQR